MGGCNNIHDRYRSVDSFRLAKLLVEGFTAPSKANSQLVAADATACSQKSDGLRNCSPSRVELVASEETSSLVNYRSESDVGDSLGVPLFQTKHCRWLSSSRMVAADRHHQL